MFHQLERILYLYPQLKEVVRLHEEYIAEIEQYGLAKRSKDIIKFSKGMSAIENNALEECLDARRRSLCQTKFDLNWIELALNSIRHDEYFKIIELKYFKKMTLDDIAENMNVSVSTVKRWRNKLIQTFGINLFGSLYIGLKG